MKKIVGILVMMLLIITSLQIQAIRTELNVDEENSDIIEYNSIISDNLKVDIDSSKSTEIRLQDSVYEIYEKVHLIVNIIAEWVPSQPDKDICIWPKGALPEGATFPDCVCDKGTVTGTLDWPTSEGQADTYYIYFSVGETCYNPIGELKLTVIIRPYSYTIEAGEQWEQSITFRLGDKLICLWADPNTLPEGATFTDCHCDYGVTSTFIWTPDPGQMGEHEPIFLIGDDCDEYDFSFSIKITVQADTIPPTTTKIVGAPQYDDGFYVNSDTPFTLEAVDNEGGSGVDKIFYRIWNNETGENNWEDCWTDWMKYSEPFSLSGNYSTYIEYYAVDNDENIEETQIQAHCVDNDPPVSSFETHEPFYYCSEYPEEGFFWVIDCSGNHEINNNEDSCERIREITIRNKGTETIRIRLNDENIFKPVEPGKSVNIEYKGTRKDIRIRLYKGNTHESDIISDDIYNGYLLKGMAYFNDFLPVESLWISKTNTRYDFWKPIPEKKNADFPLDPHVEEITVSRLKIMHCEDQWDLYQDCCDSVCHVKIRNSNPDPVKFTLKCYTQKKVGGEDGPREKFGTRQPETLPGVDDIRVLTDLDDKENRAKILRFKVFNSADQTINCFHPIDIYPHLLKGWADEYKDDWTCEWNEKEGYYKYTLNVSSPDKGYPIGTLGEGEFLNITEFRYYPCKKKLSFLDDNSETHIKPCYSGISSIRYRIMESTGDWSSWDEYEYPLLILEEGFYFLEYHSIDNLGNSEEVKNIKISAKKDIHSPEKPDRPSGPTSGKPGEEYTYTTSTTDTDNDNIYYLFDWNDGNYSYSGWLGPYKPEEMVSASHIWEEEGDYKIQVMAKDELGCCSEWSEPLSISMPKNKSNINRPFLNFLQNFLESHPILYQLLQRFLQL